MDKKFVMNADTVQKAIEQKLQIMGRKHVQVANIRLFSADEKQYAFADVSYTWKLNAWDKQVNHKDMIFILENNEWQSPIFT